MNNKLIVIEGADGAGKGTQTGLAINALQNDMGVVVTTNSFPRYETSMAGKLVGEALKGEYGNFLGLHPKLASLPFTLDRAGAAPDIRTALQKGVVLLDRYTPSNAMYQGAKFKTPEEQDEFIAWLEKIEYQELGLPEPNLVIYLAVPIEFSRELVLKKDPRGYLGKNRRATDQHESNQDFQEAVAALYRRTAESRKNWALIECVEDGQLLPIDAIHHRVMDHIKQALDK